MTNQSKRILIVEDNKGDLILARRAFEVSSFIDEIYTAQSGEEALAMLRGEGEFKNQALPHFILLDFNMPKMSGIELLVMIKTDKRLRSIPVIVFSSSRAEGDVKASYEAHANGYIAKPGSLQDYKDMVHSLEQFWFQQAILPAA